MVFLGFEILITCFVFIYAKAFYSSSSIFKMDFIKAKSAKSKHTCFIAELRYNELLHHVSFQRQNKSWKKKRKVYD